MKSIYYQAPYQQVLVYEVKEPLVRLFKRLSSESAYDKLRVAGDILQFFRGMKQLPEPTVENVSKPNSRMMCEVRDWFFAHLKGLPTRLPMLRFIFKLPIIINETDFYSSFIAACLVEMKNKPWQPPGRLQPDHHYWKHETD